MIEVEAKFVLSPTTKAALLQDAKLIGKTEFIVEFWDNNSWQLGLKNYALKRKNGRFELKVPAAKSDSSSFTSIMNELSNETDIANALTIPLRESLESSLQACNYFPRATIHTIRTTYHKEGFILDLDEADFPLLKDNSTYHYAIAEIELQVTSPTETAEAHKKIGVFAERHGITLSNTRGKHLEFIFHNYPEHYQNLIKAGIMDK